jgi:hypothetical protein
LRAAGLVSPTVRTLREIRYQVDAPFVVDSSRFSQTFAAAPTLTHDALRETVAACTQPVPA